MSGLFIAIAGATFRRADERKLFALLEPLPTHYAQLVAWAMLNVKSFVAIEDDATRLLAHARISCGTDRPLDVES